jgi:hypothetical protein
MRLSAICRRPRASRCGTSPRGGEQDRPQHPQVQVERLSGLVASLVSGMKDDGDCQSGRSHGFVSSFVAALGNQLRHLDQL